VAGDTEISFSDNGWNNDQITFSPKPLPDANTHYTEFGKLNRVTGDLEYLSQTTYDKSNRDRKVGDIFGDQWKMICAPGRRISEFGPDENVCLTGKTGSKWRRVKTTLLTHLRHQPASRQPAAQANAVLP
jgi:hypothetical protein